MRISQTIRAFQFFLERIIRSLFGSKDRIFYDYRFEFADLHPFFWRYYEIPASKFCNRTNARILHFVHHPKVTDQRPFIIEPNDHPLAPACRVEPFENLARLEYVRDIYLQPNCKRILVESKGQEDLFRHYFPDPDITAKCEIIHLGTVPKLIDWPKKYDRIRNGNIRYLCLASDFDKKGVDVVLNAWCEYHTAENSDQLLLACPNIPEHYQRLLAGKGVKWIREAPLTMGQKSHLHSMSDVAIAPLHTDGGANVIEAFEYGLPVVTMRCQRSESQNGNKNCIVIDVPFYFYDAQHYGIQWRTFQEFFLILQESKRLGEFDGVKNEFVNQFRAFKNNPRQIYDLGIRSYEYAAGEFSLAVRNAKVARIYAEI
ncbi:MAG: glycosyltransferase [Turneriella sp.]|nr:glycosyltransferase [Turneriella sp.]